MIRHMAITGLQGTDEARLALGRRAVITGTPGAGKTTVLTAIALWAESLQRWQEHDRQGGNKRGAPVTRQALLSTALSSFRELWPETGGWHRRTSPIILQAKLSTGADIAMQIRVDTTEQALVRPVPQVWDALATARRETVPTVQHMGPCGPVPLDEPIYTSPARAHRTAHGATGQVVRNALLEAASHEDRWDRLVEAIREVCGWTVHRPVTDGPSLVVRCSHATHPDCELRQIGTTGQHAAMALATVANASGGIALLDTPDAHLDELAARSLIQRMDLLASTHGTQIIATATSRTSPAWDWPTVSLEHGSPDSTSNAAA